MPKDQVTVAVPFKMAFWGCLVLTLLSAAFSVYLATKAAPNDSVKGLIETFSTTWKIGCGAFFGLLGGKALP
jgi:hypothetical protein